MINKKDKKEIFLSFFPYEESMQELTSFCISKVERKNTRMGIPHQFIELIKCQCQFGANRGLIFISNTKGTAFYSIVFF